mgnify:FL=1
MKRCILLAFNLPMVLALLLMFVGCTNEQVQVLEESAELTFKVNTRTLVGETINGVTVRSVRMIVVNTGIGNSVVINKLVDGQVSESTDFICNLKRGSYKICVVANETATMTAALTVANKLSDLDVIKVITPTTETDLVLYQSIDVELRSSSSDTEQGEVSVDGGANWLSPPIVNVDLIRVASKISLAIRKRTVVEADLFTIQKVELINLPADSYLLPGRAYGGVLHSKTPFNGAEIAFSTNGEAKSIFSDYIVPEYRLTTPASSDNAAALVITANYTEYGRTAREVNYIVPVLGTNAQDYSLARNYHYNIIATITKPAESTFPLIVEYEVVKWQHAGNGNFETGSVTFSGQWEADTNKTGNLISVSNNTSVTYEFTLSFPPGAKWTAQLTNIRDFDFDLNNNGIREGVATEGVANKIKIRPRTAVSANDVTTEFYITVFNGIENIELDLTNDGKTGEGNRFIIKQNPN